MDSRQLPGPHADVSFFCIQAFMSITVLLVTSKRLDDLMYLMFQGIGAVNSLNFNGCKNASDFNAMGHVDKLDLNIKCLNVSEEVDRFADPF
jgi:hypothetical protein